MSNPNAFCDCLGCAVGGDCCAQPLEAHARAHDRIAACCSVTTLTDALELINAVVVPREQLTAQQRFDTLYISSIAIAERMGVSRPAVLHARARGLLPDPVCVNGGQIYVWERDAVEPYLNAWAVTLTVRKRNTPVTGEQA